MHRLWLIFAQTATVCLAAVFVVSTLRPDLVPWPMRGHVVTLREAPPRVPRAGREASFSDAAARAMPSVVNVYTSSVASGSGHPLKDDPVFRRFFGDQLDEPDRQVASLGSGVIIAAEGYILTNHHVIESAQRIEVALADGRRLPARLVGVDPETDLAVLKTDAGDLPAIAFARPEDVHVGDLVLAIGNPFGFSQSVTMGIVSALGRSDVGIVTFENLIQTDAAINPGNSGGALVDTSGNLVGVNTAIYSRTGGSLGIGFAIPVSVARQVVEGIVTDGSVARGWLGVAHQQLTQQLADSFGLAHTNGALITALVDGGPAARAGLRAGDIVTAVDGRPVLGPRGLLNLVAAIKPGRAARVTVVRNRTEMQLEVTVGRRPLPGQG